MFWSISWSLGACHCRPTSQEANASARRLFYRHYGSFTGVVSVASGDEFRGWMAVEASDHRPGWTPATNHASVAGSEWGWTVITSAAEDAAAVPISNAIANHFNRQLMLFSPLGRMQNKAPVCDALRLLMAMPSGVITVRTVLVLWSLCMRRESAIASPLKRGEQRANDCITLDWAYATQECTHSHVAVLWI